jgi:hypothetical protein
VENREAEKIKGTSNSPIIILAAHVFNGEIRRTCGRFVQYAYSVTGAPPRFGLAVEETLARLFISSLKLSSASSHFLDTRSATGGFACFEALLSSYQGALRGVCLARGAKPITHQETLSAVYEAREATSGLKLLVYEALTY